MRGLRARIRAAVHDLAGEPALIYYPHAPKCAGISVAGSIARQHYTRMERRTVPVFAMNLPASARAAEATGREMMELREEVVAYHLALGRHRFVRAHSTCRPRLVDAFRDQWHFVTVLRDAVARWVSEYVYNTTKASGWAANDLGVEAYLDSRTAWTTGNTYLRYFSHLPEPPPDDLAPFTEEAVENLLRFSCVGTVEDLGEFIERFETVFGTRLSIPRKNTSPDQAMKAEIMSNPRYLERIRDLCRHDTEIYRKVVHGLRTRTGASHGV